MGSRGLEAGREGRRKHGEEKRVMVMGRGRKQGGEQDDKVGKLRIEKTSGGGVGRRRRRRKIQRQRGNAMSLALAVVM